jgi:hypothetical protein
MKPYPLIDHLLGPVLRVAMPRGARLYAPGATVHVVARCNNRAFYFTTRKDFAVLLAHLRELVRTYEVTLYAYTLMSQRPSAVTEGLTSCGHYLGYLCVGRFSLAIGLTRNRLRTRTRLRRFRGAI